MMGVQSGLRVHTLINLQLRLDPADGVSFKLGRPLGKQVEKSTQATTQARSHWVAD